MTPEPTFRPAREEDIPAACDVFYVALADLCARHNHDATPPPRPHLEAGWRHVLATGIFRVAESGGRVSAVCNAIVRDDVWFLSGFWALPECQGRGVGGRLLREVWREGERQGARVFFVWSSFDRAAVASYLRMGMLPGYQMLNFAGRPSELPRAPAGYSVEPLTVGVAAGVDAEVRGTRREVDHRFWLSQGETRGRQVLRGDGRVAGYYYFGGETVGPAAWSEEADAGAVLALACREAAENLETITLRVPGANHAAIRFALGAGLRYTSYAHFFTNAPFGRLERYLASGPLLF